MGYISCLCVFSGAVRERFARRRDEFHRHRLAAEQAYPRSRPGQSVASGELTTCFVFLCAIRLIHRDAFYF